MNYQIVLSLLLHLGPPKQNLVFMYMLHVLCWIQTVHWVLSRIVWKAISKYSYTLFSEHPCIFPENSSSILSPGRCLGGASKTFSVSSAGLHTCLWHRWSLSFRYTFSTQVEKRIWLMLFQGRFQTKAQDLEVDDREVKVKFAKFPLKLFSPDMVVSVW